MKRFIAAVMSLTVFMTAFTVTGFAESGSPAVPGATIAFETAGGAIASVLGKLLKLITFSDESRIDKAQPLDETWIPFTHSLFDGDGEQTLDADTWRMVELTYVSEKTYDDPFEDVSLDLELSGCGRLYTIPGFWDGGNTWKIRFVCPFEGRWQFRTICSDETNSSLDGRTGTVNCSPYGGEYEIYKRGFVTTREGEKYLTYDDGTPFFYLGDTHWNFGTEPLEVVEAVAAKRAEQGFTVWQSEPNGDFDGKFNLTDGVTEDDLYGFRELDARYDAVARQGLVHANAQFFFSPMIGELIEKRGGYTGEEITGRVLRQKTTVSDISDETKAYLEKLTRCWVARYGAYPVIWTLGQEVDNDFYSAEINHAKWNALNNPYKLVAEYVAKYDPYTQPVTAHQESTGNTVAYGSGEGTGEIRMVYYLNGSPSAFRKVRAHTMYAAQWSPKLDGRDDYISSMDYWYNGQGKPVVNYEGRYRSYWTKDFGSRMQGWASYLSGIYGYGWGGQGTWYYTESFNPEPPTFDGVDTVSENDKVNMKWSDSMEYPSAYQVGYMKDFMQSIKWYELVPRFWNPAYFVPSTNVYAYCASNKRNTEMVLYFYSFSDESVAEKPNGKGYGGTLTGTVGSLIPFAKYNYKWFDPVGGDYAGSGTFRASPIGTWYAGERPDDTDMALLIQKA